MEERAERRCTNDPLSKKVKAMEKNQIDHFDPELTLTFCFPKGLNSYYRKAVQKRVQSEMKRIGAKQTLSKDVNDISFEIKLSRFPFAIEQVRHWSVLGVLSWK